MAAACCFLSLANLSNHMHHAPERLFYLFDTKETGVVDFEEFLQGMATCCRGTPQERANFLFTLYDLNGYVLHLARVAPHASIV